MPIRSLWISDARPNRREQSESSPYHSKPEFMSSLIESVFILAMFLSYFLHFGVFRG